MTIAQFAFRGTCVRAAGGAFALLLSHVGMCCVIGGRSRTSRGSFRGATCCRFLSLSLCAPWLQLACMCHAPVWARSRSAWRCCSRTGPASWWPSRSARWLLRCAFTAAVATNTRKRAQGSADREACFSILTSTLGRTASADPGRAVGGDKFDGDVARMTQRWRMVRCALVRVPHALRVIIHTRVTRSANLQTLTISRTSTTWPTAQ